MKLGNKAAKISITACAGATVALSAGLILHAQNTGLAPAQQRDVRNQGYHEPAYFPADAVPLRPLSPDTQAYASINGQRLLTYVKELGDISRRSRDRGDQLWGRITGSPADAETAQWFMDKLRAAGVPDVHQVSLDLPPQIVTKSWEVDAVGGGKTVKLDSSIPGRGAPGTTRATLDLEAVYVGAGYEADFIGRDVKGKAAFIFAQPQPGAWQHSASHNGAVARAEEHGAAAVFVAIGIPGNFREVVGASTKVPGFTLGYQDGEVVRQMIEQAAASGSPAPHVKLHADIESVAGQKTSIVWGVIPGMTDEKIVINAHRDGYFESADDNASGVANALGLAEYFAKMPKEKRRRTIIIIGNSGHHNTPVSSQYMVAHKDEFFSKAALLINCEHTAQIAADLYGFRLMMTNAPWDENWYVGGGPALAPIVTKDWDTFGVVRYAEADPSPPGDIGLTYKLAPSIQLIQQSPFYHSDHDTLATISPAALENVTRAYAKIIDDVNRVDLKDLAWPQANGNEGQ
jgi:hypothetical protein